MSELTPERIRDAAAVVDQCPLLTGAHIPSGALRTWATQVQREQAAEAKREKRIQELVWLMFKRDYPESNGPTGSGYRKYAEAVIEAFPAIVDGGSDE